MGKTKYKDSQGKNLYEQDGNNMSSKKYHREMLRWTKFKRVIIDNQILNYSTYHFVNGNIEHYIIMKDGHSLEEGASLFAACVAKKKSNEFVTLLLESELKGENLGYKSVWVFPDVMLINTHK